LVPGAPALVTSGGDDVSYDALHAAVARAAAQLPAAPVAVAVPDPAGFLVAALGVLAAGGVLVPTRSDEVARRAGAALLVTGATLRGELAVTPVRPVPTVADARGARAATPVRPVPTVADARNALEATPLASLLTPNNADARNALATTPFPAEATPPALDPRAGLILATSGTTGDPRLVVLSRDGLAANVAAILDYLPMRAQPRAAVVLPLHYAYALVGQCLAGLAAGATLLLLGDLRFPAAQVEAMARLGAEGLSSVPASLRLLAEAGAPPLAYVASAGAPVSPADLRAWFPGARLFNQWGLTEAGPRVTAVDDADPAFDAGSVGRAIAGVEVTARRPDGTPCAPGELGELHVRGPSVMLGYLDEPGATSAHDARPDATAGERRHASRAGDAGGPEADRVRPPAAGPHGAHAAEAHASATDDTRPVVLGPYGLRTGDLGRVDARGFVYLAGRADDVVKIAGERVGLDEVAAALRRLPGVAEAAAAAVPDRWTGARLEAAVVLAPGADLADVRRAARATLAAARRPARLVAVPALPLTPRGKLDRDALRRLLEAP
jgi:acyl-CoA synthetase (AMP-forming)/AMP-acid ligase II